MVAVDGIAVPATTKPPSPIGSLQLFVLPPSLAVSTTAPVALFFQAKKQGLTSHNHGLSDLLGPAPKCEVLVEIGLSVFPLLG